MSILTDNDICQSCGACCATWPVIFLQPQSVPMDKRSNPSSNIFIMNATNLRCDCLSGEIGKETNCEIYENRSSVCSTFSIRSAKCNEARRNYNLHSL